MTSISLCMIVKNEEQVLENCLESVKGIYDELIIVDTGSSDRTKEIAKKYTEKVFDFEWIYNFSAARNFAFSQATEDYILWLDADDVLYDSERKKLLELKHTMEADIDAVSMIYVTQRDEYGRPSFYFKRDRLVKRTLGFKWIGRVHEYLDVYGSIMDSDIEITHTKHYKNVSEETESRNLKIYEAMEQNREEFTPRDFFYYSNELRDHRLYRRAIEYYSKFLSFEDSWVEDKIRACINLASCYEEIGELIEVISALTKTFNYDNPRPEACCKIGDAYQGQGNYEKALFWYELACNIEEVPDAVFINRDYSTWYPHLSLCVCYWELGNLKESIKHNNTAKHYKPNDPHILYNERFFNNQLGLV